MKPRQLRCILETKMNADIKETPQIENIEEGDTRIKTQDKEILLNQYRKRK